MCSAVDILRPALPKKCFSKIKFVLNVVLEPKLDLYIVAILMPQYCDWHGNYFTSSPLVANSIVFALST